MIGIFLLWYLAISFLGVLAFPLVYRLLPGLPDRGYAFARTAGWLLWGYLFWLLTSFGFTQNNMGGLVFALLLVAGVSVLAGRGGGFKEVIQWVNPRNAIS